MSGKKINYYDVDVPSDKDPSDFTYAQRRAEILQEILDAGHPRLIDKSGLANRYDVANSTITNDIDEIADSIKDHMGRRADLLFQSIYASVIEELRDEGDRKELRHWLKDFKEFLQERGKIEKEPEKHEIDKNEKITVNIVPMEKED
jgi:hypothetical protein